MSLEFEINADVFKKLEIFLDDVRKKAVPKANRTALNRSLRTLKNEMARNMTRHYKMKQTEIKKGYMKEFKARGNLPMKQVATLEVNGRPVSLIRFLTKSKRKPADQKGKTIKQRRPLRIEVKPGNKRKTKLFVQKGKGGQVHVFRRQTGKKKNKKEVMAKQSAPGLTELLSKFRNVRLQASMVALRQYEKEFNRNLKFFINKAEGRL